jgi:flagellin
MSSILTNNSSMVALETLRNINRNLETVQSEISTGKKVSNAKDNAAVWAVSTVMSSDVESFKAISDSLNLGSSTVGVARSAAEKVTATLQEIKTLIVGAQGENVDRAKYQTDIAEKIELIEGYVSAAQFNGLNLINGASSADVNVLASLDRSAGG